jgi:tRNA A37 threonylcarbamoyltransferase TsaD
MKVDDFEPVSDSDLRQLYRVNHDPDLRRVILEVVRYRRVLDHLCREAQQVEEGLRISSQGLIVGGSIAMNSRLRDEFERLGSHGGFVIKLTTDGQYK